MGYCLIRAQYFLRPSFLPDNPMVVVFSYLNQGPKSLPPPLSPWEPLKIVSQQFKWTLWI